MIFIYSWNTQSAEYLNTDCKFIDKLADQIKNGNYELAVIGLQEDAVNSGIIDMLSVRLIKDDWSIVAESELYGWGATTFKTAVKEWRFIPRGVHTIVYKRDINCINVETMNILAPGIYNKITYGKGGIMIRLQLESTGQIITFLNMHLPFDSYSLKENRVKSLMWQAYCFNHIKAQIKTDSDYLFVFGDFNFRTQIENEQELTNYKLYKFINNKKYDELNILFDYNIINHMNEGIKGLGPCFLPTCKLKHSRNVNEPELISNYNLGKEKQRIPSWCDRILYKSEKEMYCIDYDRWDHDDMKKSDHAAVFAIFKL